MHGSPALCTSLQFRRPHLGDLLDEVFSSRDLPCLVDGRHCLHPGIRSPSRPPRPPLGGSDRADAADGSTLKVTAPPLVSPVDGERAEDRRPTLIWLNSHGPLRRASAWPTTSRSARRTAVVYSRTVGESPDIGAHSMDLELDYDTVYSWRVRAHVGNPDTVGPWSSWATFLSPTTPVAIAPPRRRGRWRRRLRRADLAVGRRRKRASRVRTIRRSFAPLRARFPASFSNSCQDHGGSWEFMDRVVDALRAERRPLWLQRQARQHERSVAGRRQLLLRQRRQRFPGPRRGLHLRHHRRPLRRRRRRSVWNDVTDITFNSGTVGRTMYPRPGRVVGACTPAACRSKQPLMTRGRTHPAPGSSQPSLRAFYKWPTPPSTRPSLKKA